MNWKAAEKDWQALKGTVRGRWNKLTNDHLDVIAGRREDLIRKLQEVYGVDRIDAESEIIAFEIRYENYGMK